MPLSFLLTNLISAFLLPPLNLLLVALAGLLVARRHPRLGRTLLFGSLALLWLCATPYFAGNALRLLESSVKAVDTKAQPADAIIVLGGGTYINAPEYGTDTVSESTLVRVRYAAKLQRETSKPILAAGGKPHGNNLPEAQQMKAVLETEFKVPVRWTEHSSNNTLESAHYSYRQLQKDGVKRVYLVTHAWHMPRSVMAFRSVGFEVIPAPTSFTTDYDTNVLDFLPSGSALDDSWNFMHELVGILWYWLKT
jgi:uncharacterized SAM-binding protein YcdF (DUF218 family)